MSSLTLSCCTKRTLRRILWVHVLSVNTGKDWQWSSEDDGTLARLGLV